MKILDQRVLLKQPGRYIGWPTVLRASWGELLVVFSGDRDHHVCPFGKTQMIGSVDEGKTWGVPETINDGPIDDRDAGLVETARGTLVLSWFTSVAYAEQEARRRQAYGDAMVDRWKAKIALVNDEVCSRHLGSWIRRSTDRGRSWGPPIRLPSSCSAPHGPTTLADGRLLYVGRTLHGGPADGAILALESCDDGVTWAVLAPVPLGTGIRIEDAHEPHIVETAEGRLVAMIRHEPKLAGDRASRPSFLLVSSSEDGGRTWGEARPTGLWGFPPHLLRLRDGRLVVSYGHRREPFGERACLSGDDGRTWEPRGIVELSAAPNADLGYPSSAELADGSILTVYYQREKLEELPCLMATRWRVD